MYCLFTYSISKWFYASITALYRYVVSEIGGVCSTFEARFSAPIKIGHRAHPASSTMDTGSFPGGKQSWCGVDHPPHLALRLKKDKTIPLLPLWTFVACYMVNVTFTLLYALDRFICLLGNVDHSVNLPFYINRKGVLWDTSLSKKHHIRPQILPPGSIVNSKFKCTSACLNDHQNAERA
jgi:hypothetical protein